MEVRNRAEAMFTNFVAKGTLGEGAQRSEKLGMMDRMTAGGYQLGLDAFMQQDGVAGVDKDLRPGFLRVDAQQMKSILENGVVADIEHGLDELVGPTPDLAKLTDAQKAEMKKEMQELVTAGVMTQEELEAAFKPAPAKPPGPDPKDAGEIRGSFSKEGDTVRSIIETDTPGCHDVECYLSDAKGTYFLTVADAGDHVTANGVRLGNDGVEYKEEMIIR